MCDSSIRGVGGVERAQESCFLAYGRRVRYFMALTFPVDNTPGTQTAS